MRVFAELRCRQDLPFFLKGSPAILGNSGGATDKKHGPAVGLGIGQPCKGMNDTGTGNHQASLGTTRQISGCLRCITGCLFITHTNIGNASTLGSGRNWNHRKSDDAKHIIDSLLLQVLGY